MGIEAKFNIKEIRDALDKEVRKNVQRLIATLHYVGQTVVNEIRTSHISNWDDQTGNLRSSIGYIIAVDGKPVEQYDYPQVDGPKRGTKEDPGFHPEEPKSYARQLVQLYPKGIALIVVAGMEYASYVEKLHNKTVLAQGELEARQLVDKMINDLNAKLNENKG